jgi:hypothetical protein
MSVYASKTTPFVVQFDVEVEVKDSTKEKTVMTLVVSDLSEATEDKICEAFRLKLQSLFASARTFYKGENS